MVLGVSEADRRTIFGTKPILRSITGKGYYIWRRVSFPPDASVDAPVVQPKTGELSVTSEMISTLQFFSQQAVTIAFGTPIYRFPTADPCLA